MRQASLPAKASPRNNHSTEVEADSPSVDSLLPALYDELKRLAARRLAAERPGQTLQPTALVHETYLRLLSNGENYHWSSPGHFFAAAAEAMRRILINRARDRRRMKRGGGRQRVALDIDQIEAALDTPAEELLELDDALQALSHHDPACAALIKLRFYAGLTQRQAAEALGLAPRTADRNWAYARSWLYVRLHSPDQEEKH